MTDTNPTAVDLFCGAGGAARGLHQAGFDVRAGVDQDRQALQTYNENLPGEPVRHDLADVDSSALPANARSPVLVHGSPPCQGFSQGNGTRDPSDERNQLVWRFIEWVDELQPAAVTMENVEGMVSIQDYFMERVVGDGFDGHQQATLTGETAAGQEATDGFASIGYEARWRMLNAADFGVPQTRRRVFVIAVREDLPTPSRWFPEPTHHEGDWVSVEDAIGDLAPIPSEGSFIPSQEYSRVTDGDRNPDDANVPASTIRTRAPYMKLTSQQNEKHQKEGRRPFHDLTDPAKTVRTGTAPQLVVDGAGAVNHVPQDHEDDTRRRFASLGPGETGRGQSNRRLAPGEPSPTITADQGAAVPPVHYRGPVFNHEATDHSESHKEVIRGMEPGYTGDSVTRRRLKGDEPSGSVTVSSSTPQAHYEEIRRLTVRECARLQSFPDTHVFTGTKTAQLAQVGNAVPPKLMYRIANHVERFDALELQK